jgi:leucyl/phenylalanyl-tRNA--protein transferase
MQLRLLPQEPIFPDPHLADAEGLVGISRDLAPERLLAAYRAGIFPWFEEQGFFFWFSPNPRMVLHAADLVIHKSMRPFLNQNRFRITFDVAFEQVIRHCKKAERPGQDSSWISEKFISAYAELHRQGFAHSVEVWQGDELVGGVYGLSLGTAFFGESMFATVPNASKFGFIKLVQWLQKREIQLIDCQVYTAHLASFGAKEINRSEFLQALKETQKAETLPGPWHYSAD